MEQDKIVYKSVALLGYVDTGARPCIIRASAALVTEEDIKHANELLDAQHILQNQYEEISYNHLGDSATDLAKKNRRISVLVTIILYDLVLACYSNIGEYRYTAKDLNEGKAGQCKLDVLVA